MKSLSLILPALLLPLVAKAQPQAIPRLTLGDAIARAQSIHPSLAGDRAAALAAAARVDESIAPTRPQLSANAGASISTHTPLQSGDPDPSVGAGARFSMLLTDFGRSAARTRAARASAQAADDQVAITGLDVRSSVEEAYLLAVAQRELVEVAKAAEATANRHADEAHRFVAAGAKDPIEEATAAATAAQQKAARIRAEGSYQAALAELRLAIGDPRIPDDVALDPAWPGPLAGEELEREALVTQALARRPELAQAQLAIDAAEASLTAASYGKRPTLSLGAGLDWNIVDRDVGDPSWTAAITLNVPLLDGGLVAAQTREAAAGKAQAIARQQQEVLTIRSDAEAAWIAIRSDQASLESSVAAVAAAHQQLTLAEGRYAAGVGSPIELADAQNAVVNSEGDRVTAEWQLATARTRLRRALGQ